MKRIVTLLILATAFVLVAQADTLQFNSTNGHSYLGEPSYQYNLTLDGKAITGMCIDRFLSISYGETWNVNILPIVAPIEEQAAWLYLRAGDGSNSDYQGAVWYLVNNATALTPGASLLVSLARSQTFTPGEFAGVDLLVPTTDTAAWVNGKPQTFLTGNTPEAGTLSLLGTGLIMGAGALRKRLS